MPPPTHTHTLMQEYWRILDCAEDFSFALFYYSGAAAAAGALDTRPGGRGGRRGMCMCALARGGQVEGLGRTILPGMPGLASLKLLSTCQCIMVIYS